MAVNMDFTSDQIKKAAATLKGLRPVYKELIDFYEKIFVMQEDSKRQLHINPIKITAEMIAVKVKDNFPLINLSDFTIDSQAAGRLFQKICNISQQSDGILAVSAGILIKAVTNEKIDLDSVFKSLLGGDEGFFEKIASEFEIDKKALAFITYNSINPSVNLCSQQLSTYLDPNHKWEKGYCPVCGSLPGLSIFEGEGERFFICSFCRHKWSTRRLYCPFCDNKDTKTLNYFYSEAEPEYRVDVCESCKKYIKTVDTRKLDRIIYPPLEQVATLHFDIKAEEMGLKSALPLDLQA
ncbi:MAG: formate dehydrogenase accessory protein FdhE [Desulfobacterales bacterium]|nr:formate dehydrogenase accessory protein FdhE [Desulfobacterales bacterium]